MTPNRQKENEKSQVDKFKQAARELEADDSEERFNDIVRELAERGKDKKRRKEN